MLLPIVLGSLVSVNKPNNSLPSDVPMDKSDLVNSSIRALLSDDARLCQVDNAKENKG